jgi:CDP-6-deoxy-D-xylo-4-hexulose-3-dehydrase
VGCDFLAKSKREFVKKVNNFILYPIDTIISEAVVDTTVYNLEVENSHSYSIGGVSVHNCWCGTGEDNTCGKRFDYELDHKYTYSHIGYNLKMGDFQGALGSAQMDRLPGFIQKRKGNHRYLYEQCMEFRLDKYFILPPNEDHSWFGFTLICKEGIERNKIAKWLDSQGVHNRPVFAGNILKQPGYKKINCGIASGLTNTDIVHYNALWVGCWPGLNKEHLDYTISKLVEYTK